MEDPIIPAPVQAITSERPRSWLHNPSPHTLLKVSIALTVFVFSILIAINFALVKFAVLTHGERFEVVEQGKTLWFESSFGMIKHVDGPRGFEKAPVRVIEAVAYGAGDHLVLANIPGVEGTALGILHTNNTFENVLIDGTSKTDLTVRPDGIVLYSAMSRGESHILMHDITKSGTASSDLGIGRSPRLFADGFFVAISEKGIVRIDPVTKSIDVLLPNSHLYTSLAVLNKDGGEVLITSATLGTALLRINKTSPPNISVTREMKELLPSNSSFLGRSYIVSPDAQGTMYIYSKSTKKLLVGILPVS